MRERFIVVRRDEQTCDAVLDQLWNGALPRRHDRQARGHRLEDGVPEGIDLARKDENVGRGEHIADPAVSGPHVVPDLHPFDELDGLHGDERQPARARQPPLPDLDQSPTALPRHR